MEDKIINIGKNNIYSGTAQAKQGRRKTEKEKGSLRSASSGPFGEWPREPVANTEGIVSLHSEGAVVLVLWDSHNAEVVLDLRERMTALLNNLLPPKTGTSGTQTLRWSCRHLWEKHPGSRSAGTGKMWKWQAQSAKPTKPTECNQILTEGKGKKSLWGMDAIRRETTGISERGKAEGVRKWKKGWVTLVSYNYPFLSNVFQLFQLII